MEEKNELNDIILNKSGGNSGSKKLLLAIAALTLILIIVLVIMNSLKSESNEPAPHAATPPEPTAPTEIINDPLFEPVEVIQEGNNTAGNANGSEDLGQIAQKIKQESFDNAPVQEAPTPAAVQQTAPAVQSRPAPQNIPAAPVAAVKPAPSKPVAAPQPAPAPKAAEPVVRTPTIKTVKPEPVKKVSAAPVAKASVKTEEKPAVKAAEKTAEQPAAKTATKTAETQPAKAADAGGTYYIQVGSFTKTPNQALYDRLNASGLKYTNIPSGAATKVMVGPFQGEKAARDVLGTVRRNIESGAYITKG